MRVTSHTELLQDAKAVEILCSSPNRESSQDALRQIGIEASIHIIKNARASLRPDGDIKLSFRKSVSENPSTEPVGVPAETHTHTKDEWQITLPRTRICTLDELLVHCKVDTAIWEVERFVVNKWEVGAKDRDGEIQIEPLFQVKATLKRKRTACIRGEIDAMIEAAKAHAPIYHKLIYNAPTHDSCLLEISIPDLHIGKLAWWEESGSNYDTRIAEDVFTQALEDLLQKASGIKIDRVLFIVGNDLLNADNQANTTTSGTPQSMDSRHQQVFSRTRQLMVRAIDRLRNVSPVDVVICPGNHDANSCYMLGDALTCWYHACPDVRIDNRPPTRKYYRYHANLIGIAHGDKEKLDRLPLLMATEAAKDWGETRFREIHTGHLHKVQVEEYNGVRVRRLPSLCAADAWHSQMGFVGNVRSAEAYVWSKRDGLVAQFTHNVPAELD